MESPQDAYLFMASMDGTRNTNVCFPDVYDTLHAQYFAAVPGVNSIRGYTL